MVNALSCTFELWMHLGDVLGGLLSSQELYTLARYIVYWVRRHQRAQWEHEARSRYRIWIGEYSSYVINSAPIEHADEKNS